MRLWIYRQLAILEIKIRFLFGDIYCIIHGEETLTHLYKRVKKKMNEDMDRVFIFGDNDKFTIGPEDLFNLDKR
jgi:hypothetical protein